MIDIIITTILLTLLFASIMLHVNERFSNWAEDHILEPIQNAIYKEEDETNE